MLAKRAMVTERQCQPHQGRYIMQFVGQLLNVVEPTTEDPMRIEHGFRCTRRIEL